VVAGVVVAGIGAAGAVGAALEAGAGVAVAAMPATGRRRRRSQSHAMTASPPNSVAATIASARRSVRLRAAASGS
jgi:hypothetical protein